MACRNVIGTIHIRIIRCLIAQLLFAATCVAWAGEEFGVQSGVSSNVQLPDDQPVLLTSHETNRLGATKDKGDTGFMDFLLSVQYPIGFEHYRSKALLPGLSPGAWLPYFAFTGRFGQYIGTRDSSPVVAKRFNPKLFVRHFLNGATVDTKDHANAYIDFELAHESNGQSVNSLESFNAVANSPHNNPEIAKDYISRGWDYLGIAGKETYAETDWTLVYGFRKFLDRGLFQTRIEQYMPWEGGREITKINQVSGIRLRAEIRDQNIIGKGFLKDTFDEVAVGIETGNSQPFKYSTVSAEVTVTPFRKFTGLPVVIWGRSGYNSDLAQYYQKGYSFGIAFKFDTFKTRM